MIGILAATPLFELDNREMYFSGYIRGHARPGVPGAGRRASRLTDPQQYWFGIGRFDGERFTWLRPIATEGRDISWSDKPFVARTRAGEWWIGALSVPREQLRRARVRASSRPSTRPRTASHHRLSTRCSRTRAVTSGLRRCPRAATAWHSGTTPRGRCATWHRALACLGSRSDCHARSRRIEVGVSGSGLSREVSRDTHPVVSACSPRQWAAGGEIADLHVDRNGRLWVGTSGGGLARVDDPAATHPTFVAYSAVQGLSSNTVTAVTDDLYGRIYVATGRGLDRFSPSTGQVRHFTSAERPSVGEIRAAYREADGAL